MVENYSDKKFPYIHRDISWLSFNYRVLQEAKDPAVPLFERIKFMAIYSSNLDEFFRVRIANLRNLVRAGKKTKAKLDFDPKAVLKKTIKIINRQQEEYSQIFQEQIIPELKLHNIHLLRRQKMNEEQREYVDNFFHENLLPFAQPVLLVKEKIRPFLNNAALYLVVWMTDKEDKASKNRYAIVKIPSEYFPRFIELPSEEGRHDIIMLDDVVREEIRWLFPGYDIIDTFSIKLTRDAELYIDDEFSGDLLEKLKKSLIKRNVGPASRLVYDRNMPKHLLDFLQEMFELDETDLLREGRYHNNFDFFNFPDFGMHHLQNTPLPPLPYRKLEKARNIFTSIKRKDHLLHVPYQSYESVVRFFETAARDPKVTHIKVVQYRVAKRSRIMQAIMNAAKAGKQVSVFIEVKARFDEEANLEWGEKLEKAGVTVHYSFPGLKVHSKLALVCRIENGETNFYSYLSTGNFHEKTAKLYGDLGLFTADPRLTHEVARVFSFLETEKLPVIEFEHLLVGQFNLRPALEEMIANEVAAAKAGKKAKIILKMNSLQDKRMIELLYEASQAGVKIIMIVRGICCLIPGIPKVSDNIKVFSIVDRYLEHARVFVFHNDGDEKIYLSSADWMTRNLSYRVETIFPVYDEAIREEIKEYIRIQLQDNVKSRIIDAKDTNTYHQNGSSALSLRSQIETYYFIRRKMENLQ
jgi:polyphosphate kinase